MKAYNLTSTQITIEGFEVYALSLGEKGTGLESNVS